MGVSDAINSLRSEAVAITGLTNIVSEQISGINTDAQKQASLIREARAGATSGLDKENNYVDGKRMDLRRTLKNTSPKSLDAIFNIIKSMIDQSPPWGSIGDIGDITTDIYIMNEDLKMRDRHWKNAMIHGTYVEMYTPRVPMAR